MRDEKGIYILSGAQTDSKIVIIRTIFSRAERGFLFVCRLFDSSQRGRRAPAIYLILPFRV